jgi:two-component system NtrC family sensor kinase
MKGAKLNKALEKRIPKRVKCWEVFHCNENACPAYRSRNLRCWLFSGTHCRSEIQGKFLEKMELCTRCKVFKANIDLKAMKKTLDTIDKQFREYKGIVLSRDKELENMSMELALSLSEVFEALKKISSGDPTVRIPEESTIELINKLKHIVNVTANEIGEIVDQSHEFAIVLAEHFDILHKFSRGDLSARITGESQVELLESLKRITNETIESISKEIGKREMAEAELHKAYDDMEQRVRARTAELSVINEKLWHEIMERKKAEENLREAELRHRTVADFTHDWEYWEAPDKKLRYVSPSSERITGFTASEFIENPDLINKIIVPEDKDIWAMHHHEALKETDLRDITFRIRRKDGTVCWIEHVCRPVIDAEGNFLGVRASNRDITKRKNAEQALRESEQLLLQAHKMEAIGRLAAGIAHEINNPLAIINEKAGLIKDFLEFSGDFAQNKEKFLSLISGIFESVGRCRTITHRLLGFSRRMEVSYDTIDLNDTVQAVIEFIEKEVLYKNVRLEKHLRKDIPKIRSDKGQLQQVFLNMLNNAIDAVDRGGIIEVTTDVKDKDTVEVLIKDNGHGIPEHILNQIFEPFYTTKEKGKGTGLGLSISYGIIRKLGGTILVRSQVDRGTTFTVEIPVEAKTD